MGESKEVTRYDPIQYDCYGCTSHGAMEQNADGEYIKYDYWKKTLATLDILRDRIDEIACCDDPELVRIMLITWVDHFSQCLIDRQKGKEYI